MLLVIRIRKDPNKRRGERRKSISRYRQLLDMAKKVEDVKF